MYITHISSAGSLIIHSALLELHSKYEIIWRKGIFVTYFPFFNRLTALELPLPVCLKLGAVDS